MIEQIHLARRELKAQLGREARRNSPVSWGVAVLLLFLIFWLFIQLWVGSATVPDIFFLNQDIKAQKILNQALQKENEQRIEQIKSLKGGDEELEARARLELGMLKPGEVFYEVPNSSANSNSTSNSIGTSVSNLPHNSVVQSAEHLKPELPNSVTSQSGNSAANGSSHLSDNPLEDSFGNSGEPQAPITESIAI